MFKCVFVCVYVSMHVYVCMCLCDVCNCVCTSVISVSVCVCGEGRPTRPQHLAPELEPRRPFSSEPQAAERAWDHVPGERGAGGPSQCRRAALRRRLAAGQGSFTRRAWCTTGPTSAHRVGRLQLPRSLRMERVFLKAETDGKYRRKHHHES